MKQPIKLHILTKYFKEKNSVDNFLLVNTFSSSQKQVLLYREKLGIYFLF